jgi:hypothetical protein
MAKKTRTPLPPASVFHPGRGSLSALDVAEVLATVEPRIARLLDRRGIGDGDDSAAESDGWTDEAPVLAGQAAASVQGRVALGRQRGARMRRLGAPPDEVKPRTLGRCHARSNDFDLIAGLVVPAGQRERLERVCRYALRPPVARERLSVTRDTVDRNAVRFQEMFADRMRCVKSGFRGQQVITLVQRCLQGRCKRRDGCRGNPVTVAAFKIVEGLPKRVCGRRVTASIGQGFAALVRQLRLSSRSNRHSRVICARGLSTERSCASSCPTSPTSHSR